VFLFIYGLFEDAISGPNYVAFNDNMNNELKRVEGSGRGLISGTILTFAGALKETMRHLSQDSWFIESWVRWDEHTSFNREMPNIYKILVGKHHGKRTLRRPRHRE
jgi:hypothetical protein